MASPIDQAFVEILPDFRKFASAFKKDIDKATTTLEARFDASFARIERSASRSARRVVEKFDDAFRGMVREATMAADAAERALSDIDAPRVDIEVDVDQRQVRDEVDDAVDRVKPPPKIPINIDLDREGVFSRFVSSITGVRLPIAGFAALGAAIAAAAASAVQFTAAVTPIIGITATLPSGIGALAALMTTLKVATAGVGEAFGAALTGDAEEFAEALEGMSPAVQSAAGALREMKPALDELRTSVQGEFFADFDDVLTSLADTLMGPVQEGMILVAGSVNGLIQNLTRVATSASGVDFVSSSFQILSTYIDNIAAPLAHMIDSLMRVGTAINEAFGPQAGLGLATMITQFSRFLDEAAASGQAVAWVENAMAVFRALGDIISPLVGIIGSIGEAAAATGGNILGVWGHVLQVFDDFLNTAQGQDALIAIFEGLNQVGAAFSTILAGIAPALPPIFSGLSSILDAVLPLIGPLAELIGSVLAAAAPILKALAAAIKPIIAPLTRIITLLGDILVDALDTVMPLINLVAELLGGALGVALEIVAAAFEAVAPIITVLLRALQPLIQALQPLISVITFLADIIGGILEPVISVLGTILLWLVENVIEPYVIPVLEFLGEIIGAVLVAAIEFLTEKFEQAGAGLKIIFEFIYNTAKSNLDAMKTVFDAVVSAFQLGWKILNDKVFTPLKNIFNSVKTVASSVWNDVKNSFNNMVNNVKGIPGRIKSSLSSLWSPLWEGFKSAINSVIDGWNNLSFTVPSVDLGALGSVGGFTISTPNIPRLRVGGMSMGEGIAHLDPNEAILPLEDRRTESLLAGAITRALEAMQGTGALAGAGAGSATVGDVHVDVRIGETPLNDIVDQRITVKNRDTLRRARAGMGGRL